MVKRLFFNNTEIPLTAGTYTEERTYVDNRFNTEAGTIMRVMVRSGIVGLKVNLVADESGKATLDRFADEGSLAVKYYSEINGALKTFTGFIDGYSAALKAEDTVNSHQWYDIGFSVVNMHD